MKAIVEFEFNDKHVYGDDGKQELPNDEYHDLESVISGIAHDAYERILGEVKVELGIHDFFIQTVTDENSDKFSYILSTSYPAHISSSAFDIFDTALKNIMGSYKGFLENYNVCRFAWKEYDDGKDEHICHHDYQTVQFLAVKSEIREIQTCIKCKESIAKLVKSV